MRASVAAAAMALTAGALTMPSGPAAAQVAWDRWTSNCKTDAMTDRTSCRVSFVKRHRGGEFFDLSIALADGNYLVMVTGSRGLGIVEGCAVRVDEQPHMESDLDVRNICLLLAKTHDTAQLVRQMQAGAEARVRLYLYGRGYEDVVIPLSGFSAALREAGMNPSR